MIATWDRQLENTDSFENLLDFVNTTDYHATLMIPYIEHMSLMGFH